MSLRPRALEKLTNMKPSKPVAQTVQTDEVGDAVR